MRYLTIVIFIVILNMFNCVSMPQKEVGFDMQKDTLIDAKWAYYSFIYNLQAVGTTKNGKRILVKPTSCNIQLNRKFVTQDGYENFVFLLKAPGEDSMRLDILPLGINGVTRMNKNLYDPLYHMTDFMIRTDTISIAKEMQRADSLFRLHLKANKSFVNSFLIEAGKTKGLW